jgi:anti-sigma regulatory factor (Ser/Thr protein kinase)
MAVAMERPLSRSFTVRGKDFLEAGSVSTEIKSLLKELGVDTSIVRRVAIAAYEAEMNIVMYAVEATVTVEMTPEVITIVADDRGPGIPDVELAMQEGYSTATREMREMGFGAGMGLANIKKNADAFTITSTVGRGTRLEISVLIN